MAIRRFPMSFQQPPDEIRQKIFVATDRRIDAAGPIVFFRINYLGIQFFAHAVKTLEFIVAT